MLIVAGVFARGGSKGVPNKNLRKVGGVSLVRRAVIQAINTAQVGRVICSTDSEAIASEAKLSGAEANWLRPAELAQDTSREWDSWVHMINHLLKDNYQADYLLVVPCVAPLRTISDLEKCIDTAIETNADVVIAVSESHKNPWFNMVSVDPVTGSANLVLNPPKRINNRQEAPVVYDVSTVAFLIKCSYLLKADSIYEGDTRAVILPKNRCLDIDTEDDIKLAEYFLSEGKGYIQ